MGTWTYPSDPVTAGATAIQSTTFACVAADYTAINHEQAKAYMTGKSGIRYFPTKLTPGWSFYIRNDLSGANANLRNLIGMRVQQFSASHNAFSVGNGSYLVPVVETEIWSYNWIPVQRTLSDSSIISRFKVAIACITLSTDVENASVGTDVGETRTLDEAVGFLLLRAAATTPVLTPATRALAGIHPLG
jgi:hypothetical protein